MSRTIKIYRAVLECLETSSLDRGFGDDVLLEAINEMLQNPDRTIETTLDNLLDLVHVSQDYGFDHPIFLNAIAEAVGKVSDQEILAYANTMKEEEDREQVLERLNYWREEFIEEGGSKSSASIFRWRGNAKLENNYK